MTTELDFVLSRIITDFFFFFIGRSSSRPSPHHGTKSVEAIIDNSWRGTNSNTLDNKVYDVRIKCKKKSDMMLRNVLNTNHHLRITRNLEIYNHANFI